MTHGMPAVSAEPAAPPKRPRVRLRRVNCNQSIPYPPDSSDKQWWMRLKKALGTTSSYFLSASLSQLMLASKLPFGGISETAINAALAMIEAAAPRDEIEGALAIQMACTRPSWDWMVSGQFLQSGKGEVWLCDRAGNFAEIVAFDAAGNFRSLHTIDRFGSNLAAAVVGDFMDLGPGKQQILRYANQLGSDADIVSPPTTATISWPAIGCAVRGIFSWRGVSPAHPARNICATSPRTASPKCTASKQS